MSELFPRCPKCGSICWQMAGGEYICSDPACKDYDKIVEPVLYDIRRRRKNENNTSNSNSR